MSKEIITLSNGERLCRKINVSGSGLHTAFYINYMNVKVFVERCAKNYWKPTGKIVANRYVVKKHNGDGFYDNAVVDKKTGAIQDIGMLWNCKIVANRKNLEAGKELNIPL